MGRVAGASKRGRAAGPIMIVCGTVVAVVVAISGNIVADSLPAWLTRWALPAFLIGSLLSVIIGVIVYRLDRRHAAPAAGALTARDRIRLLDGVAGQAADMLWLPPGDPPPLRLGLRPRAGLVSAPRQHFAERLGHGAGIVAAYEQAERTLLILGGPGSGKSRQLAELTAHLAQLARTDPDAPVPVLVSLATWSPERGPLAGWIVRELKQRYDVPVAIGTSAVAGGHVQPLLDGLDEAADVAACVAAVNAFRDGHGLVPLVVCSRLVEYERCGARLRLRGAVELHPPSPEEVRRYLDQAGVPAPVIQALEEDMGELLGAPLTLGLIGRTCREGGVIELAASTDRAQRWAPLFDAYVERMLHRVRDLGGSSPRRGYREADVRQWLGWLAGVTESQFRLDHVQPDMLPAGSHRVWVRLSRGWHGLLLGPPYGLLAGLIAGWLAGWVGLPRPVWWGIVVGLSISVIMAVRRASDAPPPAPIEPAEVLRWQWDELPQAIGLFVVIFLLIAVLGLGAFAVVALATAKPVWSTMFSATTLGFFLVVGSGSMLFMLADMAQPGLAPASRAPNEGIHRSVRHALLAVVVAGMVAAGVLSVVVAVTSIEEFGIGVVIGVTTAFAPIVGFRLGGLAAVKHYALRVLLVRCGCMPWQYVRFLEFATERVLLRRVGGAYEFLHPMMRDHLAAGSPVSTAAA